MTNIKVSDQPVILNELLESLAQAAGGASQLIHTQRDPRWMFIREIIECTQGAILEQATFAARKVSVLKPL